MLDEAAEIGDEQGAGNRIAADALSSRPGAGKIRGYLGRGGQRQMVW
jgi:hypothetical protein